MEITNLVAELDSNLSTSIILSWVNPTEVDFSGANIYQDGILIISGLLEETFTVSNLNEGQTYQFLVSAFDGTTSTESEGMIAEITIPASTIPEAPVNLTAVANDDIIGVGFTWEYPNISENILFQLYLDGVQTGAFSNDTQLQIADLIAGKTYEAHIIAINKTTAEESSASNTVLFEIKGLEGSEDPKNWIGVKLDNLTVTYQK